MIYCNIYSVNNMLLRVRTVLFKMYTTDLFVFINATDTKLMKLNLYIRWNQLA